MKRPPRRADAGVRPHPLSLGRGGAILLEAVLALAILGVIVSGAAWMASESLRALNHARTAEAEMRDANRLLTAVSLWPVDDLDRRLGSTVQGPWHLRIDRVSVHLYEVALLDPESGNHRLIGTTLFRGPGVEAR